MEQRLTQKQIQFIRSLHRTKHRHSFRQFIIQGDKICREALQFSRIKIHFVCGTANWIQLNKHLIGSHPCYVLSESELKKISLQKTPNQSLIVCHYPELPVFDDAFNRQLCFYLDGIQDPGNLGTIIRTLNWFQITPIYTSKDCTDPFHPKVIQASMGASLYTSVISMEWAQLQIDLKKDTPIIGLTLLGHPLDESWTWPEKGLIVLGNESHGVRAEILKHLSQTIYIPGHKKKTAESLNAAVACSIIAYSIVK